MSALPHPSAAAVRRPRRALRFTRDDELVRLVRAGDERAFEAMYDRHHRGILSFCRHMLGSREEAEDAVQHTFLGAHRDLVASDKPIQLKAWLYTIARNRCLSMLRARREERALDDVPEPAVEGLASEVQRRQDLRDMLSDLQRLPEDQRAALVLSELGALSHEEIGSTLGVRKDKVKALVFQARESLASSRTARDADCREIQEQLAVLHGGSLRRTTLRRHIEVCPACAAFKAEVTRQRGAMAALLPVVPSLALKETILSALAVGGGAAGGGGLLTGGLLAASGTKALVAKVAAIAVVTGGATGGGLAAVDELSAGGDGGTATAMAGVPPEQRSVELVVNLRERAHRTAIQRAADRHAAATGTREASAAAAGSSEPQLMPVIDTRGEARGGAGGVAADRGAAQTRSDSRTSKPAHEAEAPKRTADSSSPPRAAAPPASPAPPAPVAPAASEETSSDAGSDVDDEQGGGSGDKRKGKGHRGRHRGGTGRRGRGPKSGAGAPTVPQPPSGHDRKGERDGPSLPGHRGRKGKGDRPSLPGGHDRDRRGEGPKAPLPQVPVPQPPTPAPSPGERRRPRGDRGRRGPSAPAPQPPAPAPQIPQPPSPSQPPRGEREGRGPRAHAAVTGIADALLTH